MRPPISINPQSGYLLRSLLYDALEVSVCKVGVELHILLSILFPLVLELYSLVEVLECAVLV